MSIKCINSPNRGDNRHIVISVYRSPDMGGSVCTRQSTGQSFE